MKTQPSDAPVFLPFSIIGPQFITPDPLEIIVDKFCSGNFVITDINQNILLKVKPCDTRFNHQRFLLDANDKPIVLLREKSMTLHSKWNAYRGDSKADSDLIFSAKTEHMTFRSKTSVNVLLANKMHSNDDFDFKIKGIWLKKDCTIYKGDSSTTIAQMHTVPPKEKTKYSKDKFMVTIRPNMDYAFVVALIAIVDAIENPDKTKDSSGVAGSVFDIVDAVANS